MSGQRYSVTIDVGADISSAKSAAQQLKNVFEGIGLGAGQSSKISGMFKDLDKAFDEVARRSSTALTSIGEVRGLDKAKERVVSIINAINSEFAKMGKLGDTDLAKNFGDLTRRVNDASKAIKTYNSTIGSLSKGHTVAKSRANELGQELAEQTKYYEQLQRIRDKFKGSSDKDISEALAKRQSTAKGLATRRQNELESFVKAHNGRINADKTVDKGWRKSFESKASAEDVEILNKLVTAAQNASNAFKTAQENYQNFSNAMSNFKGQKNFDELTKSAREAADELKKFESGTLSTEAFNKLKSALEQAFGPEVTAGIQNSATAVEEFQERINQISAKELDEFRKKVPEIDNLLNQLANTGEKMGEKVKKGTESFYNMKEAASDIEHLSSRLKYFFSLAGGFNLMRRAIRSAVTTTKELDAVMTQTAVVSSYTVSDMWKTLPQYSKEAKKLGVAIKDVYSAQTLYVQQGLDMNSAMQIGIETMKMARVANIGAEEATNSMTAALRGFNMELTERSAKRVNDVYSKLAQNTASNTQEISTAMTKTAALANSANMSFENTAAFLATIIESTREGAETAGTALKTVIARFTEVKKLYSKGELTGTDEEGQEVNVNKISAALRTAGINMNDFFTGAKGLDEIFMELGSKWDSLTTVQQRYIATMAAGSRQQSRFLALMQNYNRTLELSSMAYNSAGSGQEQFDKTLDSLEAKINKFKDAWDTFVMSLTNSDAIKGIVDFGTEILDLLNNLIDKISGGNGAIKSILSLGSAFGIFKVGRSLVKGLVGTFKGDQSKGLLATLLGNRAEIIKHFSDIKAGFQRPLFTRRKGVGAANRKALIEAEEDAKKRAQAAQTAYNNEVEKLNNGSPVPRAINPNLTPQERERVEKKWKEKQLGKVKTAEDDLSKKNQEVTRTSQESATALQNYGAAMSAVGVAAGIVAGLLGLVANHLEETGKSDLAKVVKGLALGLGVLSATLMLAGSAFQAFGAAAAAGSAVAATAINAIPVVGWIIGIVTVLTTAGTIIAQFVETAKEKLENAEKAVEEHAAYLSGLKDKYSEVSDTITSIGEQQDAIANMTERTLEWSDAVEALNKNLKDFISDYPEYANAVQFDEHTGQLTLDLEAAKEIQEKQAQIIEQNEQEQRALKIYQATKQYRVDLEAYSRMYVPDNKGGIPGLSEKYYSSGFSKYNSQFFNKLGRSEYRFTSEDLIGLNDAFSTGFLEEFFGEDFLKNQLEIFNGVKVGDQVGDLANFFMEIRSLVGQAESYKNYYNKIKNIARPEAVSYALNAGNYSGVVKSVAQQIYEKEHDRAFNNYSIKDVDDTMIADWAERNHYTLVGNNQYSYQENGATVIKKINKDEVLASAQYEAATQAAKKATDQFFQGIANESYAITSGKGTYRQYTERYNATLEERDGQSGYGYYVKSGEHEKNQLYNIITDNFLEARKRISTVAGTDTDKDALRGLDDFYLDLNYLQTTGIANLVESWQSKFGTSGARGLLSGIEEKLKHTDKEKLSNVTDDLLNILQQVESGAITSLEDFNQALLDFGLEGFNIDIGYVFKKPKTFEQAQEAIKSGLELWNTARTSNVFNEEDMKGLMASGQMSKKDFVLTSQGYVSTKSQTQIAGAAKSALIDTTESAIGNLNNQISVIENFNKGYERWTNASPKELSDNGVDLDKINNILSSQDLEKEEAGDIRNVLKWLLGDNGKVYNKNTGQLMNISDIADNDLASYLSDILANQDTFTLRSQRASLEAEKESILNNKLLDLAPTIQSAIVDLITKATEKGINVSDKDIDTFIGGRAQFGSDRKYNEFLGGLEQLDWDEIDDIDDFTRKLKDLGIEFNKNSDGAKNLFNRLKEIYATDTTPAQKVEKQLSKVEKAKSATERLASGEKVFSKEDIDNLRDVLGEEFREQDWARTGSNEWTYIGQETNSLLSSIDGAVQVIAAKIINEAKEAVRKGQRIPDFLNTFKLEDRAKIFNEDYLRSRNSQAIKTVAENLGIGLQDEEGNLLDRESLISLILDYYDKYYGENGEVLAANTALVDSAQTTANTLLYQQSGQGLLNNTDVTDEERSKVLDTRVKGFEAGEQYMVQQDLEKFGPEYSDVLKALALDAQKADKNFDSLTQAYKDNASALKTENKGTREYGIALGNLTKAVKIAFGNNERITEKFVDEHLDLFKDYSEGVEGADDKIRQAMLDEGIIDGTAEQLSALQTAIDGIDGEELTINGTADCSQAFSELAALYGSAEAAAAAMAALGYSVTWEPDGTTTMQMPDGSTRQIPNYRAVVSDAAGNALSRNKGGGGGGGGGKKEFKNDFDKYYNQVEDINELERQRNLLEKDYNQLLKSESLSGKEIYDNLKAQIELLKERRFLVQDLAEKRKQQILDTMQDEQYKNVAKYSWWNEEDQTIEIDWQSINKIKDSETGNLVKEYVSKLEDFQSKYDEQIDALEDIEDTLQEIKERGKDQYQTTEERLRDALIKQIQDKIDELTEVNEAINETNQKLFDSISETLELQRQERENAKTEEELTDKEKRLAYLQQDSSNANALEIKKLQEELADARESYTDTLIDQKISELQKQNEEAQEQRQEQIDLMQRSLEWQENSGAFWNTVYQYISEGTDAIGALIPGSNLVRLLKEGEAWDSLSEEMQMNWLKELETLVSEATGYLALNRQLEDIGTKEGTEIEFITADGRTLKGKVDKNGNVVVTNDDGSTSTYKDVYQDYYGTYKTLETEGELKEAPRPVTTTKPEGTEKPPKYTDNQLDGHGWYSDGTYHWHKTIGGAIVDKGIHNKNKKIDTGNTWTCYCSICNHYIGLEYKDANKSENNGVKHYASGGLADRTGPAWLDGTKSHPELVLNARDTQNFIELKDVLADMRKNGGLLFTGGDNYYDIKIQVDSIGSDYDIDRAIDRIKARIVQDGAYRNVNTLSRLR